MIEFQARHIAARRLRELRHRKKWTVQQLARLSAVAVDTVKEYEAATSLMLIAHLEAFADVLDVSLTDLLALESVPSNLTDEIGPDEWELVAWYRRLPELDQSRLRRYLAGLVAEEYDDEPVQDVSIPKLNDQELEYIKMKFDLTDRQIMVLQLSVEHPELSLREIGIKYGLTEQVMYQGLTRIYRRFKVKGRAGILAVVMDLRAELAESLMRA